MRYATNNSTCLLLYRTNVKLLAAQLNIRSVFLRLISLEGDSPSCVLSSVYRGEPVEPQAARRPQGPAPADAQQPAAVPRGQLQPGVPGAAHQGWVMTGCGAAVLAAVALTVRSVPRRIVPELCHLLKMNNQWKFRIVPTWDGSYR